jgi:tetratricopeptide (TPR) repeat protein
MSQSNFLYNNEVYSAFKELDKSSFREVVQYFESNKKYINHLEQEQYFEILATYAHALFELGIYGKYIKFAEEVLQNSIENNIYEFEGEDIYSATLFRIAASHYNIYQVDKAEKILKQLLRMHPDNTAISAFYKKILSRKRTLSQKTRAISIVLLLVSAMVIATELLIFRPFFQMAVFYVEISRNILFVLGFGTYLFGELANRLTVEFAVKKELSEIVKQKAAEKADRSA